jgi:hypothetical protein
VSTEQPLGTDLHGGQHVPTNPDRERWAAAQTRLIAAFDPRSEEERRYIQWLMSFLVPRELDLFLIMIERRVGPLPQVAVLAYDKSLTTPDAMRRIRDTLGEHYGVFDDPDEPL